MPHPANPQAKRPPPAPVTRLLYIENTAHHSARARNRNATSSRTLHVPQEAPAKADEPETRPRKERRSHPLGLDPACGRAPVRRNVGLFHRPGRAGGRERPCVGQVWTRARPPPLRP